MAHDDEKELDRRQFLTMHGLGRHRRRLDDVERRARTARRSARLQRGAMTAAGGRRRAAFVQISDSHIGFGKTGEHRRRRHARGGHRPDQRAARSRPDFLIHTGDLTHLVDAQGVRHRLPQVLKGASVGKIFYVPGEHDVIGDGSEIPQAVRQGDAGRRAGTASTTSGVHFIGLVNVAQPGPGRARHPRHEQLDWLKDRRPAPASTPIVVFAHVPLWSVYPEWGWGTEDGQQALALLKRFGSVTVLNGHIHQMVQKVEGNVTFHTAMSTAFPQPAPGSAPSPGPMKVPTIGCETMLGLSRISFHDVNHPIAITDLPLEAADVERHASRRRRRQLQLRASAARRCRSDRRLPGRTATTCRTTSSVRNRSSSHRYWIPTSSSRTGSTRRVIQVFLLDSSEDDRNGGGAMTQELSLAHQAKRR